jgi:hypothetical protein
MYEDSGPAMNATAAADAAGGAGDESRFPESVLITLVPDDWTLTPGSFQAPIGQHQRQKQNAK